MHDERATISRILAGDTAAFRLLVEGYQSLVLQFARNMLRTIEDAEDISQEVFVAAFQSLRQFDATRAKFSTWLLSTTTVSRVPLFGRESPESTPRQVLRWSAHLTRGALPTRLNDGGSLAAYNFRWIPAYAGMTDTTGHAIY